MWSMVSYIQGRTQAKGIWEQDPEANIWTQESPLFSSQGNLIEKDHSECRKVSVTFPCVYVFSSQENLNEKDLSECRKVSVTFPCVYLFSSQENLIEKYLSECRKVSVTFPCVYLCLSSVNVLIFSLRVSLFFFLFLCYLFLISKSGIVGPHFC